MFCNQEAVDLMFPLPTRIFFVKTGSSIVLTKAPISSSNTPKGSILSVGSIGSGSITSPSTSSSTGVKALSIVSAIFLKLSIFVNAPGLFLK